MSGKSEIWTDDEIERLTNAWKIDGKSAGEIAKEMTRRLQREITRESVCGKVNRLGLMGTRSMARSIGGITKPSDTASSGRLPCKVPASRRVVKLRVVDVETIGVPFVQRGPRQCVWPLGEPTHDMLCCGRPKESGKPYCAEHHAIAYEPATQPSEATQRYYAGIGRDQAESGRYAEPKPLDQAA